MLRAVYPALAVSPRLDWAFDEALPDEGRALVPPAYLSSVSFDDRNVKRSFNAATTSDLFVGRFSECVFPLDVELLRSRANELRPSSSSSSESLLDSSLSFTSFCKVSTI